MSRSCKVDQDGWVTVNELTVNGCEGVPDSGLKSTLAESLAGSLAAAASPSSLGSESGHSGNSSPATPETNSIRIGYTHDVSGGLPSIDKLPPETFERMAAREFLSDASNYIIVTNPANCKSQPRAPRSAHPRTCPDILNAACLVELFPDMAKLPSAKVSEWIETCNRSADESYEAKEASPPANPQGHDQGNKDNQQQDAAEENATERRPQSQDPQSDSELPEDPHGH